MKQYRLYIFIIALALGLVILAELFRPKSVDWRDSFSQEDKVPYGAYILHDQLTHFFPGQSVDVVDKTVYQVLANQPAHGQLYMFVNAEIQLSKTDSDELLRFVSEGGTVFMAAESFSGDFTDSLGIETSGVLPFLLSNGDDSVRANFSSPAFRSDSGYSFGFASGTSTYYFALFNEDSSVVLGNAMQRDGDKDDDEEEGKKKDEDVLVNFLKVKWGAGTFYLSTLPRAFSNIGLLSDNGARYAAVALSYLPVRPIIWDEYYKAGGALGRKEIKSPLRYILSQEPLRWAYSLLLGGAVLFVIFGARRRQRIIPVIEPPRNTTLEFVETVGTLYHQHGDFRNVADKMILYFLDYVRSRLNLSTGPLDNELVRLVAERSGVAHDRVSTIFNKIREIQVGRGISKEQLLELSDSVEYFYRNSQR